MENKTELMRLRHPDYDRTDGLVRKSRRGIPRKMLDYHENDIAAALKGAHAL